MLLGVVDSLTFFLVSTILSTTDLAFFNIFLTQDLWHRLRQLFIQNSWGIILNFFLQIISIRLHRWSIWLCSNLVVWTYFAIRCYKPTKLLCVILNHDWVKSRFNNTFWFLVEIICHAKLNLVWIRGLMLLGLGLFKSEVWRLQWKTWWHLAIFEHRFVLRIEISGKTGACIFKLAAAIPTIHHRRSTCWKLFNI